MSEGITVKFPNNKINLGSEDKVFVEGIDSKSSIAYFPADAEHIILGVIGDEIAHYLTLKGKMFSNQ